MPLAVRSAVAGTVVVAAIGVPVAVGITAGNRSDERIYENSLAACERGNPIRSVVFNNTETAIAQAKDPEIKAEFKQSMETLLTTPGIDAATGKVDCDAVVQKP